MMRLWIRGLGVRSTMLGTRAMKIAIGSPVIVGVMKEANTFPFILFLKGWIVFVFE